MADTVASDTAATAMSATPEGRGWRWFVLALVLMVCVTTAPQWTPSLALLSGVVRLLFPIEQFAVVVLLAVTACAIVGWRNGGSLLGAVVWMLVAAWMLWQLPFPFSGYGAFLRGWVVSLGAAFGLLCLTTRAKPFLGRALAATGIAALVTVVGFSTRAGTGGTFDEATRMLSHEYQRRTAESVERWRARTASPAWRAFAGTMPSAAARADDMVNSLSALGDPGATASLGRRIPRGPLLVLAPALLALESLLALGLGWSAYHRLSRVRLGPPLGALRELRFNDQLVWGVVVGATVVLLPTLVEWRAVGANCICFFGTLYALRGAGVLTWWIPDRVAALVPLALVILVPLLGPIVVLALALAITFVLGLGDTWRDFRAGAPSHRPTSFR